MFRTGTKGFTLIELLVVIAIIGILASIVLVSLNSARSKGRDSQRISEMREMQKALELYYSANNHYPITTCAAPDTTWTSFDSISYSPRKICPTVGAPGVNTLAQEMAPYVNPFTDPKPTGASDAGYLYQSPTGQSYCFMSFRNPEDLTVYPAAMINPSRCGSGNTTAQCSANGTYGSAINSIFIGNGSYATAGC